MELLVPVFPLRGELGPSVPQLTDAVLQEELALVEASVDNKEVALDIVARAVDQFPSAWKKYLLDHRERPDKPSPRQKRPAYNPIFGERELLRTLVLNEMDEWERGEEIDGRNFTPAQRLKTFIRQLIILILNSNSYYAAVAMMQVLCDYPAKDVGALFRKVDPERADGKNESTVSRIKNTFLVRLKRRMPDLRILQQGSEKYIESRLPESSEIDLVAQYIRELLPPESHSNFECVADSVVQLLQRSRIEMSCVEVLLLVDRFNRLASKYGIGRFEDHLRIPVFSGTASSQPSPNPSGSQSDVEKIRELAARHADRRNRIVHGSTRVDIEGVEYPLPSAPFCISDGAVVLKLVATSIDGQPVVLDTLVLAYEEPDVVTWEPEIPNGEHLSFTLRPTDLDGRIVWQIEGLIKGPSFEYCVAIVGAFGCGKATFIRNLRSVTSAPIRRVSHRLMVIYPEIVETRLAYQGKSISLWQLPPEALPSFSRTVVFDDVIAMFDVEQYSRQSAVELLRTIKAAGLSQKVCPVLNKIDLDPDAARSIAGELRELMIEEGFDLSPDFRVVCISAKRSLFDQEYCVSVHDLVNRIIVNARSGWTHDVERIRRAVWRSSYKLCEPLMFYLFRRRSIDQLFHAQASCLDEFLVLAERNHLDLYPAPRIYERDEKISRLFGGAALIGAFVCFVCLRGFGASWFAPYLSVIAEGGLLLAGYRYGWSGRLYRRYVRYAAAVSLKRRWAALVDVTQKSDDDAHRRHCDTQELRRVPGLADAPSMNPLRAVARGIIAMLSSILCGSGHNHRNGEASQGDGFDGNRHGASDVHSDGEHDQQHPRSR